MPHAGTSPAHCEQAQTQIANTKKKEAIDIQRREQEKEKNAAEDTVSERLRSWTRNPMGSARRGSNPLGVELIQYYPLAGASVA